MELQLKDRLAELPYRLRPRARAAEPTWGLTAADLSRIQITWPSAYHWAPGGPIVETLKDGFVGLGITRIGQIPQPHSGATMIECVIDGRRHVVAIDYNDFHDLIAEQALAESSLYFKAQFRKEGYSNDLILPGGYLATGVDFYRYYRPFRARYARRRRVDVVGRFGYKFQPELRKAAVAMLEAAPDIDFVGTGARVRYSRFLRESASARLALQLPGNGQFTYRVIELLGLGTCMVSIPLATTLHVPLEPGVHYVEVASDLSDLVERCRYYISHDAERERIAQAGREFFDRYLHCDQLARYYVRTMLDRLGS